MTVSTSPGSGAPVAMATIEAAHAGADTAVEIVVRDKPRPARVAKLPFVRHRYVKRPKG